LLHPPVQPVHAEQPVQTEQELHPEQSVHAQHLQITEQTIALASVCSMPGLGTTTALVFSRRSMSFISSDFLAMFHLFLFSFP
jgi:hypothetical protein